MLEVPEYSSLLEMPGTGSVFDVADAEGGYDSVTKELDGSNSD